jgi:hypothetical protein
MVERDREAESGTLKDRRRIEDGGDGRVYNSGLVSRPPNLVSRWS